MDQEVRLRMDTVAAEDGIEWLYIFTNEEESHKKPVPNVVMEIPFRQILEIGLHNDKVAGYSLPCDLCIVTAYACSSSSRSL